MRTDKPADQLKSRWHRIGFTDGERHFFPDRLTPEEEEAGITLENKQDTWDLMLEALNNEGPIGPTALYLVFNNWFYWVERAPAFFLSESETEPDPAA